MQLDPKDCSMAGSDSSDCLGVYSSEQEGDSFRAHSSFENSKAREESALELTVLQFCEQ